MSEAGTVRVDAVETERQRAEAALREREAVRQQALESSPDAVFAIDRAYRLLFNNQRHQRVLVASGGQPLQVGKNVLSPAPSPEVRDAWRAAYDRALQGEEFRWETAWTDSDGRPRFSENTFSPLRDTSGEIIGVLVVAHDITERKRAERTRQAGEERYRAVVEDHTEVISRFRADGTILFVNEVLCRFFGKTSQELIGQKWQPRVVPEDVPLIEAQLQQLAPAHPVVAIENRVYAANGEMRWMQFVNRAFFDPQGCLAEIQSVGRDITERKRLEAERAEAVARLVLVEEQVRQRLSRELHDQTTQRLVALAVELKTLETNLAAGRPQAERVRALRKAVDDLQQQVRQLAWDLRAGELVQGGLERALREYVEDWSERAAVPADCECRRVAAGPRLPAPVEATLYRVAQESLANVEKHAQAGRVSVLFERDETLVRLTVEDDGRGFAVDGVQDASDSRPHLGLLGMHERVALVGGTLLIESSPGSGTTILVRIPLPTEAKPL